MEVVVADFSQGMLAIFLLSMCPVERRLRKCVHVFSYVQYLVEVGVADFSHGMLAINRCRIFLSYNLLSNDLNIKIYKNIIFRVFCVGVKLGRLSSGRNVG